MTEHVLFIDSREEFTGSTSNVDFSVIFNRATGGHTGGYPTQSFKNVTSVELTGFSVNNYDNDTNENYLVLDIEELNNRLHSNVPEANQAFATIYIDDLSRQKSFKGHDFDVKKIKFDPPLSSLSRLTIKVKNPWTRELIKDTGKTTFIFKIMTQKSTA